MPNHIPMQTLIAPCVTFMATRFRMSGGKNPAVMMGAIGDHESGFATRDQMEVQDGKLVPGEIGPATGYYQFERNGGVAGVMAHPASQAIAQFFVDRAGLPFDRRAVWEFFVTVNGDELATVFARLLLLTDPQPLPVADFSSEEAAFNYYLRNWRPGAWFNNPPDSQKRRELRAKWSRNWAASLSAASEVNWDNLASPAPVAPAPSTDAGTPMRPTTAQGLVEEIRERLDLLEGLIARR